ncbi:MFS transporter [Streptomyces sp. NPDC056600]|uniref:MFS transporter n=1 Tax=Streptomyces sp. NPDC056600 TaxID=3345874 RepID=UPI0036D018BE
MSDTSTGRPAYGAGQVRKARYAVATVFAVHGAVAGSFASRVPWVADHASVSAGQLGLALAMPALGASLAMPLAGRITHVLGARAAQRMLLAAWTLTLVLPGLAPNLLALCLALFTFGATAGMADVVMNASGVEVENLLDRSIMSGLHGMWSTGALLGSAGGTLAAHLEADGRLHFMIASAVLTVAGLVACSWLLDIRSAVDEEPPPRFALPPRSALLIGAIGFCAVFAEGASLDWSAVYLRDVLGSSATLAAACTTGFTLTMALARFAGDPVVDRFGAVRSVRVSGALAALGGVLVVLAPHPAVAMTGFALLGLGIAVVVPLCFAAAGRSGPNPSQAIAGVATITYTSGLVAPGAIGALAEATSLVVSFALVTLLACGVAGFAGVLRAGDRERGAGPAGGSGPGPASGKGERTGVSGASRASEHPAG